MLLHIFTLVCGGSCLTAEVWQCELVVVLCSGPGIATFSLGSGFTARLMPELHGSSNEELDCSKLSAGQTSIYQRIPAYTTILLP